MYDGTHTPGATFTRHPSIWNDSFRLRTPDIVCSDPRLTPSVRDRLTDLREAISLYVQLELAQLRATMNDAPEVGGEPRLDTFRKQTLRELDRLAGLFGGDRPFPP